MKTAQKTAQIHKNVTLDRQNKNSMAAAGKINIMNYVLGQTFLTLKKNTQIEQKKATD